MTNLLILIGAVACGLVLAFAIALSRYYRKAGPGEALVRSGMGGMMATTAKEGGMWALPFVHYVDVMDLTAKQLEFTLNGQNGLICKDNLRTDIEEVGLIDDAQGFIRVDVEAVFVVRVDDDTQNIQEVAESIGCERASTRETLVELFDAKFSEALSSTGKKYYLAELRSNVDAFKADLLATIGDDLNGFRIDSCDIRFPGLR